MDINDATELCDDQFLNVVLLLARAPDKTSQPCLDPETFSLRAGPCRRIFHIRNAFITLWCVFICWHTSPAWRRIYLFFFRFHRLDEHYLNLATTVLPGTAVTAFSQYLVSRKYVTRASSLYRFSTTGHISSFPEADAMIYTIWSLIHCHQVSEGTDSSFPGFENKLIERAPQDSHYTVRSRANWQTFPTSALVFSRGKVSQHPNTTCTEAAEHNRTCLLFRWKSKFPLHMGRTRADFAMLLFSDGSWNFCTGLCSPGSKKTVARKTVFESMWGAERKRKTNLPQENFSFSFHLLNL